MAGLTTVEKARRWEVLRSLNDRDAGYIIGWFLADGCATVPGKFIAYKTPAKDAMADKLAELTGHHWRPAKYGYWEFGYHPLHLWLITDYGMETDGKKIIKSITSEMRCKGSDFMNGLVAGFIDGDGSITHSSGVMRIKQCNKNMPLLFPIYAYLEQAGLEPRLYGPYNDKVGQYMEIKVRRNQLANYRRIFRPIRVGA